MRLKLNILNVHTFQIMILFHIDENWRKFYDIRNKQGNKLIFVIRYSGHLSDLHKANKTAFL